MKRLTVAERKRAGREAVALVELFMREHLRFTGGELAGRPFAPAAWQRREILEPVFGTLDAYGRRVYREALIGLPRWNGKSQVAAGLGLALMFTEPVFEGEYYVVATTKPQAGIVFQKARRMVISDPYLRAACRVYRSVIEVEATGATFRALPWDADTAQGLHPAACVIDEYHVHRDTSMREAMISGMVGAENGLLVTITTAGDERRGPLWDLLESAPKDPRAYVYWAGAGEEDDPHDPKVWRRANPARWISVRQLRDQYRTLPLPSFERLHLNRYPTAATNRAYRPELWYAGGGAPAFDPKRPTMLGLDASWTRDSTALVMAQRDAAGRAHVLGWVWEMDRAMGHIDHEAVVGQILELCRDYNVVRIGCDPNYFRRSMIRLEHEFGLPIEEFPQDHRRMSAASMTLYDVLQEGRLVHGSQRELTEHVLNAGVKPTSYGWRITRVVESHKIDAVIALAIAVYLAEAEAGMFRSFAETGGIYTLPFA